MPSRNDSRKIGILILGQAIIFKGNVLLDRQIVNKLKGKLHTVPAALNGPLVLTVN